MEQKLTEKTKCPICLQVPKREVFQCKNGHTICSECSTRVLNCPSCRVRFEADKIRNRALEDILDMIAFDCEYKEFGCGTKLQRGDIIKHLESCSFGGTKVKLCQLLGYPCEYVTRARNIPEAGQHLISAHKAVIRDDPQIFINLEGIVEPGFGIPSLFWNPVILKDFNVSQSSVLIKVSYNETEHTVSFNCVKLLSDAVPQSSQGNYGFQFVVKSLNTNETPDIIWATKPFELKHAGKTLESQFFRVSYKCLLTYAKNGVVTLLCRIFRDKSDQELSKQTLSNTVTLPNVSKPGLHGTRASGAFGTNQLAFGSGLFGGNTQMPMEVQVPAFVDGSENQLFYRIINGPTNSRNANPTQPRWGTNPSMR